MHYQRHSVAFKRALVEQSLQPGASVSRLAREQGVNANQIFNWRRAYRAGQLEERAESVRLLPVRVSETAESRAVPPAETPAGSGRLVLAHRGRSLSIEGLPDPVVLAQVLEALLR